MNAASSADPKVDVLPYQVTTRHSTFPMALSGKNSRNNHLPVAVVESAFKNNKLSKVTAKLSNS